MTPPGHTPGTWKAFNGATPLRAGEDYKAEIFPDDPVNTTQIATVYCPGPEPKMNPNARIIAAAPDLLEALEVILAHAKPGALAHGLEAAASAAIRKARGEGA